MHMQMSHVHVHVWSQVAQLAGYVAEHSAYHHGETSLVRVRDRVGGS